MATARLVQGTTFTFDDNLSSPVSVTGLVSISLSDGEATEIDVTNLGSSAREKLQGLQDFGDCTIEFIRDLDDAGQAQLLAAKALQATRTCIVTLPSGTLTTGTFEGFVKSFSMELGADDTRRGTAVIAIDGAVTWS